MRKVFAHRLHSYADRAKHVDYGFPPGIWREVPDEVAEIVLAGHPAKLCDVTNEENPDAHICEKTEQVKVSMPVAVIQAMPAGPPLDRQLKPVRLSKQNRIKLKAAKKRSRVVRLAHARAG